MSEQLFKVTFAVDGKPLRVFYVRASTPEEAHGIAVVIEAVLERPERARERTLKEALIEAVATEEEPEPDFYIHWSSEHGDSDVCTLADFLAANAESLNARDVARLRALPRMGEIMVMGEACRVQRLRSKRTEVRR